MVWILCCWENKSVSSNESFVAVVGDVVVVGAMGVEDERLVCSRLGCGCGSDVLVSMLFLWLLFLVLLLLLLLFSLL